MIPFIYTPCTATIILGPITYSSITKKFTVLKGLEKNLESVLIEAINNPSMFGQISVRVEPGETKRDLDNFLTKFHKHSIRQYEKERAMRNNVTIEAYLVENYMAHDLRLMLSKVKDKKNPVAFLTKGLCELINKGILHKPTEDLKYSTQFFKILLEYAKDFDLPDMKINSLCKRMKDYLNMYDVMSTKPK